MNPSGSIRKRGLSLHLVLVVVLLVELLGALWLHRSDEDLALLEARGTPRQQVYGFFVRSNRGGAPISRPVSMATESSPRADSILDEWMMTPNFVRGRSSVMLENHLDGQPTSPGTVRREFLLRHGGAKRDRIQLDDLETFLEISRQRRLLVVDQGPQSPE